MFGMISRGVSLKVITAETELFLRPSATRGIDDSSEDPTLRGVVILTTQRRLRVTSIHVALLGHQEVCAGPGTPSEKYECLRKDLNIKVDGQDLPAGENRWTFSFVVPSTTAPYQKCSFGRTYHFVEAIVSVPGKLNSNVLGRSADIKLVANPYAVGAPPQATELRIHDILDDVGVIGVTFQSSHMSIAAPILIDFSLLHPPDGLEVVSVKAWVVQTFEVTHQDGRKTLPTSEQHSMFETRKATADAHTLKGAQSTPVVNKGKGKLSLEAEGIHQPEAGVEWHHAEITRMPSDGKVRPTTLETTESPIRVAHRLAGEIRYKLPGQTLKAVTLTSKPVTIVSCCCQFDDLILPAYAMQAPPIKIDPRGCQCQCKTSLQQLLDNNYAPLLSLVPQAAGSCTTSSAGGSSAPSSTGHERKVAADQPVGRQLL